MNTSTSSVVPRSGLWSITRTLAWTDFKLRYAGSALGYFWTVSKPLLLFGVLYAIFTRVLRFGDGIEHYPVMLLFAIVLWSFFTEVTSRGVTVLVGRADVLRKVALPRIALPLSVVLTGVWITAFNLFAVLIFVLANGLDPQATWLLLPLYGIQLIVLSLGLTLMLSVAYVSLRDVGQVWDLVLQLLFYAAPIIYPVTLVPEYARKLVLANPIAQIIQQSREALVGGASAGSFGEAMPGPWAVLPYAITVAIFLVGLLMFNRTAPYVAERL